MIQCAGLWFVGSPAKVSITWNLKQVIVRKPKTSSISDDTCFLTVRPADLAALKAAPQPELELNDNTVSALVEDSDGEEEYQLPPPAPTPVVVEPTPPVAAEEPKKKKVIAKKKTDA